MVPIINSSGVRVVFQLSLTTFCEPCIVSYTTDPWTSWKRNGQAKLQLATHGFHNHELWVAWVEVGCGTFKNPLQIQVTVNWQQLLEIKLNLYLKFIRYYVVYYFASFSLNNPYTAIRSFKWIITLQPSKIGHVYVNYFDCKDLEIISSSDVCKSWIYLYKFVTFL